MTDRPATLSDDAVREWIAREVPVDDFTGARVLVIVPDSTRTAPLPLLFGALHDRLAPVVASLDVLVALGTHPPMAEPAIRTMLGITEAGCADRVRVFNHEWDRPEALRRIGTLDRDQTERISGGLLSEAVPVEINSRIDEYDRLLVLGPVFPHEVVGFSGGNKYFFPGIAGPELLHFFHWLGALITNVEIIGVARTPVREVVDLAAGMIAVERRCLAFVVDADAAVFGLFYGSPEEAWEQAAALSGQVHIKRVPRAFDQVLSCAPTIYDELWVAGKCMYKLEAVVADGGELIIYAPHLETISATHGTLIEEVGYHVRDYFTKQWDRFAHVPRGVLAHSTHVRGAGKFEGGIEQPRVRVTLATAIPEDVCRRINLGWRDPGSIDPGSFTGREHEGVLMVPKAGEQLYRLSDGA